jgi:ferredoxin
VGWKTVKKIRIAFSLSFLALVSLTFLDPWHIIPKAVAIYLTSVEVVPGLLKVLVAGGTVATAGFAAIVLITMLFGRVYCSTVCPIGTIQDISIHFSKRFNRRKRFKYYRSPQWFQYLVLLTTVAGVLFAGSMFLGDLLEPFSNYGRLLTDLAVPPVVLVNNFLAGILTHFELYFLFGIPLRLAEIGTLLFTFVFFATVICLSVSNGRLFCNSFCPAGAILSVISRVSIFKLIIKNDLCNDCGACDRVCKAECINSDTKRIDFTACVSCFNCLYSCPTRAITYSRRLLRTPPIEAKPKPAPEVLQSRRELIRNVGIPAAALLLAPGIFEGGAAFSSKQRTISPPGSLSVRRFTSTCTACHLCVASCPTDVLRPSFLEYGIAGMSQPMMDYEAGYCNYDCVICGDICPAGAILKRTVDEKKRIQIGKAKFSKEDCIVVSKKKDCAACSEHCPTKAVHTVPYEGNLLVPEVDDEICIGCGACEHVCPVIPKKAIRVEGNSYHLVAKKPKVQEASKPKEATISDFPF